MMKIRDLCTISAVFLVLAFASCTPVERDSQESSEVEITPYASAGVQFEYEGTVIHVDPCGFECRRGDYSNAAPADVILITDTAGDHLQPDLIAQLRKPGAPVVVASLPEDSRDEPGRERLLAVPDRTVMNNGDRMTIAGIDIEAVPMYDLLPGDPFHARGEGNGYVLTLGSTRIYVSGVTECVPEIQTLTDIDIAFMPLNLPNGRMEPLVAADCVKTIRPSVVYPYHYRELPLDEWIEALSGESDIEIRLHNWYP